MKKQTIISIFVAALMATAMVACADTDFSEQVEAGKHPTHVAAVQTVTPETDESGTKRVFVGDEVVVAGQNLDHVAKVLINKTEAEIVEKTIRQMTFKVPDVGFAQQDNPHYSMLYILDDNKLDTIYRANFYLTVPVTDAIVGGFTPAEGTIGTEITIKGRNLEQITSVSFGGVKLEGEALTLAADAVKFVVPVGTYEAGNSTIAITAEWAGGTLAVTGEESTFTMKTPKATIDAAQGADQSAKIGDEVSFSGENLDLITKTTWGAHEMVLVEQSATKLVLKTPSSIEQADPVVQSANIVAEWGAPVQTYTLAENYKVDTTPVGPAKPVFTSLTAEDGGADNRLYLKKVVTVKGQNLISIEGFEVDGVAATLVEGGSDTEVQFIVPDGVNFTAAKEVALTALYNGANPVDFGKVTVYPFYYWKDVVLGVGDKSNHDKAFFVPDMGGIISAEQWSDPYAGVNSTANVLDKTKLTEEQYYSVKPYIFATSGSSMAFICPTNSTSQLKNMKKEDGTDVVDGQSILGTPIVAYRNLGYSGATESEQAWEQKVKTNDITSLTDELPDKRASSGAPKFVLENPANNNFTVGSVLLVQYVTYEYGQLKSLPASGVRNTGFIYVKSINPEPTSASNLPKTSTITMDVYWSKPLN
ncbi:MAG: IPT/TIG domain-containing protein [Tidjanibacter sp.]|nr:IPT/TIG domain-containing protein [Tidjanibacter sp.]